MLWVELYLSPQNKSKSYLPGPMNVTLFENSLYRGNQVKWGHQAEPYSNITYIKETENVNTQQEGPAKTHMETLTWRQKIGVMYL